VLATGAEPFHATSHGAPVVEYPDPGEPIWVDDTGVTCRRWNWRQTTRTAIHPGTQRVGFIIDSLDEGPDTRPNEGSLHRPSRRHAIFADLLV
jgi:DNA/RNA-binding domain of Phe-tRNA-synthetase-like protein